MSSYVYYKFKAQKTETRIAFDGTGISVFDLKKEIILSNSLGKATDFDLLLFDSAEKGMMYPVRVSKRGELTSHYKSTLMTASSYLVPHLSSPNACHLLNLVRAKPLCMLRELLRHCPRTLDKTLEVAPQLHHHNLGINSAGERCPSVSMARMRNPTPEPQTRYVGVHQRSLLSSDYLSIVRSKVVRQASPEWPL